MFSLSLVSFPEVCFLHAVVEGAQRNHGPYIKHAGGKYGKYGK